MFFRFKGYDFAEKGGFFVFNGAARSDVNNFINIEKGRRGRKSQPFISFSKNGGHVRIAAFIARHGEHVDIQIDYSTRTIRVKKVEHNGVRINVGGVFTRKVLVKQFLFGEKKTIRVDLTQQDDGWFYGDLPVEFTANCA
ncbi:hypothetical protein B9037_025610 [Klebsiella aerogenes]|nr:hypothetical protein B9037_025610 [Klebsiella aerogenes]HDS4949187.1 hypothetical protein [Klebsiella aerogenes]